MSILVKQISKQVKRHYILLSMLLHLLILILTLPIWMNKNPKILDQSAELYIPSYVYQPSQPTTQQESEVQKQKIKNLDHNKIGAMTRQENLNTIDDRNNSSTTSYSSFMKTEDAVHLIGDKKVNQPLIELLGKAIYKHLIYPKIAIDFHLSGVVSIGFLVQPNGVISDVSVVHSSGAEVLDNAALSAIKRISPVKNVDKFLHESKYLVANIIFR